MKRIIKISLISMLVPFLGACDIMDIFRNITGAKPQYENYEKFYEEGLGYKHSKSYEEAKEEIRQGLKYWTVRRDTLEKHGYVYYYAPFQDALTVYDDHIYFYTTCGMQLALKDMNNPENAYFTVSDKVAASMVVKLDNHKFYYGDTSEDESRLSEEQKDRLNIYPDEQGYLVVVSDGSLYYLSKDLKDVYVNDTDTNVFHLTEEKSITITNDHIEEALTFAKSTRKAFYLPKPSGELAGDYWYGNKYYDIDSFGKKYEDREHRISWYNVVLPGYSAYKYAEDLEKAGFSVYRANDEDLVWTEKLKYDAYWVAVDENEQYKVTIHDASSLYVDVNALFTDGPEHSTMINIDRLAGGVDSAVAGKERTTDTDWSNANKQKIAAWPGTNGADWPGIKDGIPFWPLGENYSVPTQKTYAYSGLYSVLVEIGVKCYNITDNYYRNLLDGYGDVLVANGYKKYELPATVDVTDYSSVYEWYKQDDHKFYNAYINEEKDIAIRFYFDISGGNTIRVFQASKVRGWDPTADPDHTDYYDDY